MTVGDVRYRITKKGATVRYWDITSATWCKSEGRATWFGDLRDVRAVMRALKRRTRPGVRIRLEGTIG